jgi:signal transduction histidine kinase
MTDTTALMRSLVCVVERHWAGTPIATDARMASPMGLRLLDLLRRELLWHSPSDGEPSDPANLVALLRALDQVSSALDSSDSREFAGALSGPRSLELFTGIAHDLRSPLASILLLADSLRIGRSGAISELQHQQLGLIYSSALGLDSLTSDLVELMQGSRRLVEADPIPFSLSQVFESVHDILRPVAEERGLQLQLRLSVALTRRLGHPHALSRILLNLISNALKFTEDGYVDLAAEDGGDWRVAFSIRDTGRGISPAALKTLYQPFRWSEERNRYGFSSTGLGLALCKKLVDVLGSQLRVATRAGWGTRFEFDLELPPA